MAVRSNFMKFVLPRIQISAITAIEEILSQKNGWFNMPLPKKEERTKIGIQVNLKNGETIKKDWISTQLIYLSG